MWDACKVTLCKEYAVLHNIFRDLIQSLSIQMREKVRPYGTVQESTTI